MKVPRRSAGMGISLPTALTKTLTIKISEKAINGKGTAETSLSQVISEVIETNTRDGNVIFITVSAKDCLASSLNVPVFLAIMPKSVREKTVKTRQNMSDVETKTFMTRSYLVVGD
jgi:hypothetical protein